MLKNTFINLFKDFGERPGLYKNFNEINSDLQAAYKYIGKLVKNKSILDFGCGGGYGSEYLSKLTDKSIVGYDVDSFAISSANHFFKGNHNLSFTNKLPNEKFDIIVSFQVIEHIPAIIIAQYLNEIVSHLKPNGKVFIATPNKLITSYKLKTPIFAFHTVEYTPKTFTKLLKKYFSQIKIKGQISQPAAKLVNSGKFNYSELSKLNFKQKMVRVLSQIKPIRFLAGHIPQAIKNLFLGQNKIDCTPQLISTKRRLIDNSYILIAECTI